MRFGKWKVISGHRFLPRIILKWKSKECDGETSIAIRTVTISGVSKYFDEILGDAQSGKFLDYLEKCELSKNDCASWSSFVG